MKLCYHCMTKLESGYAYICPNCHKELNNDSVASKYLQPGSVLNGRFIMGYPLGEGGFGNTYIGWDDVLQRKVAIKEFYPKQYAKRAADGVRVLVKDEIQKLRYQNGLRRFMKEARSVASLQDIKGVVAVSHFFEENGTGYIIMEYLEGMNVMEILKKSGNKKDYEWCRRVILTVLHTLREIHKRGVLHRDISPDNIFVTNEGVIKLIDFGAAKNADMIEDANTEIMLKVGYAPIEQYSRQKIQGTYTDIYALAAVFYRMLTGQKPFPADKRIKDDALITPSEMGISIPRQAEMAIMVCLNVKPEYRLQSADEFMEALDGKSFEPVYEPEWILPPVEEKKGFDQLPFAAKLSIGLCVLLLALGTIGGAVYVVRKDMRTKVQLSTSGGVVLEDYSGQNVQEAVRLLEDNLGIQDIKLVYEFSEVAQDQVIRQEPQPGNTDKMTEVTLYVSGTDELYTISDFVGKDKEEIVAWFSRYNFSTYENDFPGERLNLIDVSRNENLTKQKGKIALNYEYSDDVPKDVCMLQSINSGIVCAGTDDVIFTISAGSLSDYELKIPNLVGLNRREAESLLNESGLSAHMEIIFTYSEKNVSSESEGKVISQSSEADSVFNILEKKIYVYKNGKRIEEKKSTLLVIMLEEEKHIDTASEVGSAG